MLTYIAGSGAMGCRFGAQLAQSNQKVILLDNWDEHIQKIQKDGLKVTGTIEKEMNLSIMRPSEATEPADYIILFTKAMQLPKMLEDIQQIINEDTKVVCLLNGLGHEEVIRQYVPEHSIIMGVTVWTASLSGPGHVHLSGTGEINLQSLLPSGEEAGRVITEMLNKAGLNATYESDVISAIWRKACVNGTMNSNCAVLDCTVGELFASSNGKEIINSIIDEFVEIAELEGISLDDQEMKDYVYQTAVKAADHYPSMHQDLIQNNRLTEIDYLNGYVARKAQEYEVETPYCEYITKMVHLKESLLVKDN